MEHFLNPRNMGKVEDANGVGKVGNVVCLLPNQNIHINNDLKVINKISTKDEVLSHDGQYNTVRKTSRRNYN